MGRQGASAYLPIVGRTLHVQGGARPFRRRAAPRRTRRHESQNPRRVRRDLQRTADSCSAFGCRCRDYSTSPSSNQAPADRSRSRSPIATLMQFSPGSLVGHRVRIQGIATLRRSNGTVFIKDATGGPRGSDGARSVPVSPGDRLDVVGFAAPASTCPSCRTPSFRTRLRAYRRSPCSSRPTRR